MGRTIPNSGSRQQWSDQIMDFGRARTSRNQRIQMKNILCQKDPVAVVEWPDDSLVIAEWRRLETKLSLSYQRERQKEKNVSHHKIS